jgi:predicted AAA+ superfamily ATPase
MYWERTFLTCSRGDPQLLRHLYLSVARLTGQEIAQVKLAEHATVAGIPTNQPTVGKYLHYLADALLIREFRRYPLAKKASARVPAKVTVDLSRWDASQRIHYIPLQSFLLAC